MFLRGESGKKLIPAGCLCMPLAPCDGAREFRRHRNLRRHNDARYSVGEIKLIHHLSLVYQETPPPLFYAQRIEETVA